MVGNRANVETQGKLNKAAKNEEKKEKGKVANTRLKVIEAELNTINNSPSEQNRPRVEAIRQEKSQINKTTIPKNLSDKDAQKMRDIKKSKIEDLTAEEKELIDSKDATQKQRLAELKAEKEKLEAEKNEAEAIEAKEKEDKILGDLAEIKSKQDKEDGGGGGGGGEKKKEEK